MGNKGSATTTTSTAPNPQALGAYSNIMNAAAGVAATPYSPFTGEGVAPVNAQQYGGIGNVNEYANFAMPYVQEAGNLVSNASQPITEQQIQNYESPYTQDVVQSTENQFANQNAQQLEAVKGNAIAQGALGGNREAIAEAETTNQQNLAQAPVIANLENQGYSTGLNTALTEQQEQLGAAAGLGNLGVAGENAALTGANAQIGAGTLEQGTQQAQDVFNYQQYLSQLAYPYQQLQFEAGIDTGVGSQMGGTGTTTAPAPSLLGQLAGVGASGLGILGGTGAFGQTGYLNPSSTNWVGSDRRIKENIEKIGKLNDGQTIYRFNYKGEPETRIGLIAQDVEKVHPEAVREFGGVKGVDLDAATRDSVRHRWHGGGVAHRDAGGGVAYPTFGGGYGTPSTPYGGGKSFIPGMGITHGQGAGMPRPPQSAQQESLGQQMKDVGSIATALQLGKNGNQPTNIQPPGTGVAPAAQGSYQQPGASPELNTPTGNPIYARGGGVAFPSNIVVPRRAGGGPTTSGDDIDASDITINGDRLGLGQPWQPDNDALRSDQNYTNDGSVPVRTLSFVPGGDPNGTPSHAGLPPEITQGHSDNGVVPPDALGFAPHGKGSNDWSSDRYAATPSPTGVAPSQNGVDWSSSGKLWPALMAAGLGMMASRSPFAGVAIGEGGLTGMQTYAGEQARENQQAQQEKQNQLKQSELALEVEKLNEGIAEHGRPYEEMTAAQKAEKELKESAQKWTQNQPKIVPLGAQLVTPEGPDAGKVIAQNTASSLSPDAVQLLGRRLAGGDSGALTGLPQGTSGAAARSQIQNAAADVLINEGGMTPQQAAAHLTAVSQQVHATGMGLGAEARTSGTREANLNMILATTDAAVPAALEASQNVARTGWVPINKIIQGGEVIASDPNLKSFGMANLQLAEGWARAMNPTGVMRESDRDKALSFLNTADSPETYAVAVRQLQTQIQRERDAVHAQRPTVPGGASPSDKTAPAPSGSGAGAGAAPTRVIQNGHTYERQPDGSYRAVQ